MSSPAADWSHSPEAEQSLLGGLILDGQAFEAVRSIVSPADFYTADHAAIFASIAALHGAGRTIDLVTLGEHMGRTCAEVLAGAGGIAYLGSLAQNTPSARNITVYASIVRERAVGRRLHTLGLELCQAVQARGARDVGDLLGEAFAKVRALREGGGIGRQIRAMNAGQLLNLQLPELEPLLYPWLMQKTLAMVHARRGVGKTHLCLAIAYAVATGGMFLGWRAPVARRVVYTDGEMPLQVLQARLRELFGSSGEVPELLQIVTPDIQDTPMPDLATVAGQAAIDALIHPDTALIVIDNLSCLLRSGGAESDAESWTLAAEWALRHRKAGRAVLFVHHSGKSGAQRGTSKREDLLDVVINLRRPPEHLESDGAVFTVNFEKARSITGDDIAPVEAKLETVNGAQTWTYRPAEGAMREQVRRLWEGGGITLLDVSREACCSKSHAHKLLEAMMAAGELKRAYPARRKPQKETT